MPRAGDVAGSDQQMTTTVNLVSLKVPTWLRIATAAWPPCPGAPPSLTVAAEASNVPQSPAPGVIWALATAPHCLDRVVEHRSSTSPCPHARRSPLLSRRD